MDQHLKTNRSGFSLIEICMAIMVFGITSLLLTAYYVNAAMGMRDARARYVASLSAEKKMRELRIAPYTVDGDDKDTMDHIICARNWSIIDTNFVRRINIKVGYKSLRGTDRYVTLTGAIK